MDHLSALEQLRTPELLHLALQYAIWDRRNCDFFFDPFELEFAQANRQKLVFELSQELANPIAYQTQNAFVYYSPKNSLCDRRMTYIQIKDLTIRYAIAILFSNEIEQKFHTECFANRRATGNDNTVRFSEDFATGGWARFAFWQRSQCVHNSILLRTDLSSFYDSISHDYLIDSVCRHLRLPSNCLLIHLLRKLLTLKIINYSSQDGEVEGPNEVRHGLPIGDGVEGFLANIYLKDVDDAMRNCGARYGRYVDDIRLFGNSRADVVRHLRILQERLLAKGLNLNASKTTIAENAEGVVRLVSRSYSFFEYGVIENEKAGERIEASIDRQMDEFDRSFAKADKLESGSDARDFCKYLSSNNRDGSPMLAKADRQTWHVGRIVEIITRWRGPTRHATWLLIQTACNGEVNYQVRLLAIEYACELLLDPTLNSYAKYRLIHHLCKLRQLEGSYRHQYRLLDRFPQKQRNLVLNSVPMFLSASGFELNLVALYLARSYGCSQNELRGLSELYSQERCEPVKNAVRRIAEIPQTVVAANSNKTEPDETHSPY